VEAGFDVEWVTCVAIQAVMMVLAGERSIDELSEQMQKAVMGGCLLFVGGVNSENIELLPALIDIHARAVNGRCDSANGRLVHFICLLEARRISSRSAPASLLVSAIHRLLSSAPKRPKIVDVHCAACH
jgi:hypothetical protein